MARIAVQAFNYQQYQLVLVDCAVCGEVFAAMSSYIDSRRRDCRDFHCPNGHTNAFRREHTAEQREKRELQHRAERAEREAQEQRRAREWAERSAKGAQIAAGKAKAAQRRLLHRVACGVCPHCQRTFKQLAAHMKSQHQKV